MNTKQIEIWSGEFGRAYTERNSFASDDAFNALYSNRYGRTRDEINEDWLGDLPRDIRILEVGANVGNQLRALRRAGFSRLYGIEIQRYCVERAKLEGPGIDIIEGSAFDIPFKDNFFDLVFTNNVLIHIAPADLAGAIDEIIRVSGKYIWGLEYYAPEMTGIHYHDHDSLLWKGDYAARFLERSPDLLACRVEQFECQDEPGTVDQMYLLELSN